MKPPVMSLIETLVNLVAIYGILAVAQAAMFP
jgi:hypothetical protein